MKKLLFLLAVCGAFVACNNSEESTTTEDTTTTTTVEPAPMPDTTMMSTDTMNMTTDTTSVQ